jgi:rhamnose transport system substrate-binding protein
MNRKHRWPLTVAVVGTSIALALTGCSKSGGSSSSSTGGSSAGSGGKIKVAFVPKLQGIPYFEAMNVGGMQAAKDLGINWIYDGPTTADPTAQADIVRALIQQKVGVIIVAPNDPNSLAPVMKQAQDAGIKVLTSDTDAPNSVREAFVEQASAQGIGEYSVDTLAKAMGDKGEMAIVSCGETAANLNSWIQVEKATVAKKYPNIKVLTTVYAGEDQNKATQMATDLLNANPNLNGLIGQCTSSAPAVAQAVRNAGKIGKVFTVGVGTPKSMAPYLADGSSSGSILWDVQNLGYLTAWAGMQMKEGKPFQATNDVSNVIKGVKWNSKTKELLLGPPVILTKANVNKYNY